MSTLVKNKDRAEMSTRTTKGKRRGEGGKISLLECVKDGEERFETVFVEPAPKAKAPCITLCSATAVDTDGIEMNLSFLDVDPQSPKSTKQPAQKNTEKKETRSPSNKRSKKKSSSKKESVKESKKERKVENRDESPSKKRFSSPIRLRFTNSTDTATVEERDASAPKREGSAVKERSSSRLKSKASYAQLFASVASVIKKKGGKSKSKKSVKSSTLVEEKSLEEKSPDSNADTIADSGTVTKIDESITAYTATIDDTTNADTTSTVNTVSKSESASNLDVTIVKSASEVDTDYDHSVTSFEPSLQSSVKGKTNKLPLKKNEADKRKCDDQSSPLTAPNLDSIISDDGDDSKKSPVKKVPSLVSDNSASLGSVKSGSMQSGMFAYTMTDLIKGKKGKTNKLPLKKNKADKRKSADQSSPLSAPNLDSFISDDGDDSKKSPVKKGPSLVSDNSASPGPVKSGSMQSGMFAYTITDIITGNDMKHAIVKDESNVFAYTVNDLISSPRTNSGIIIRDLEKEDEINMVSPIASPRKDDAQRTLKFEPTDAESADLEVPVLETEQTDVIDEADDADIENEEEDDDDDDDDDESLVEKKKKKKFGLFRRTKKSKKIKAVKPKKTKKAEKKKKDSKASTKVEKSKEIKVLEETPTAEEEDPAESVQEDTKEVIAIVGTSEKSVEEEEEEFFDDEVSAQGTSVQDTLVQASSVQNSIVSKDIKKISKSKFASVFRRGKKSKKVKVPRSPTSSSKKSKKASSTKKIKGLKKNLSSGQKSKKVDVTSQTAEEDCKSEDKPTAAEVISDETCDDVIGETVEPLNPDEEPTSDSVVDDEAIEATEPEPTLESLNKSIIDTVADDALKAEAQSKSIIDTVADDASKVESVATQETTNVGKGDAGTVVSVASKSTVFSRKSRSRQLSGKLKKLFSSNASIGGSIASKRKGYSISDTAANSTMKVENTVIANKSSTVGLPPLPTVLSTASAEESTKEPALESKEPEEVVEETKTLEEEPALVSASMSVADTLVTSESRAYVERDLRSIGTTGMPLPMKTESLDNVEQYLDVEDDDKFEYMPDVLFTSFSNSTCNDDKYGACDESVASESESIQQSCAPKSKTVILRNVSDVAGFELDLIDSVSKASSMRKTDSEFIDGEVPSTNVPAANNEDFNPSPIEQGTNPKDALIANKDAQLLCDDSVSKSPSKLLDSVEQVLVDEDIVRNESRISVGSKTSKNSKLTQGGSHSSKKSFFGRTSSKLSLGSRVSKTSALSNAKNMERGGSRVSVGSKGSKGSILSKKLGLSSSKLSVSSKTSKKSLTKLETTTPAVIQMDPNIFNAVISPLNMQQAEDPTNEIAVDGGNSVAKGDESDCGWFGVSCQDRFNCFNYSTSQSIVAEVPEYETDKVQSTSEVGIEETITSPETVSEQGSIKEDADVVVDDVLDNEPKELPKDENVLEVPAEEEILPISIQGASDGIEAIDVKEVEEMKMDDEETQLRVDTEELVTTADSDTIHNFDTSSPASSTKSLSKKKSIFKRSLKFISPAKSFKKNNKAEVSPKPPLAPVTTSPKRITSPKRSISFKKIGSPFKGMSSPRSAPVFNEEDLIDSGVVETAVFAASVVLKKGGPTSTAKSSASVVLISGLKKGKNLPPKLEKNINKDSTVAASVAVDALSSGIAQPKVVPLILNTLEAKGYRFTPYKPVSDDQSTMAPSTIKSNTGANSVAESKNNASTNVSSNVASLSTVASAMREQRSQSRSSPIIKSENEYVGFRDKMDTVESNELTSRGSEKFQEENETSNVDNNNVSESCITEKKSAAKYESTVGSYSSDSVSSESEEAVPRSSRIATIKGRSPQHKYNEQPTSPDKNVNTYMDKNKDNKALSRVLASLNLSQESSSSSSD